MGMMRGSYPTGAGAVANFSQTAVQVSSSVYHSVRHSAEQVSWLVVQ